MSIRAIGHVLNYSRATTATDQAVLLVLADAHNDEKGYSWLSVATIAQRARSTVATIRRSLSRLEKSGDLQISRGVGRATSRYYLQFYQTSQIETSQIETSGLQQASSGKFPESGEALPEALPEGGQRSQFDRSGVSDCEVRPLRLRPYPLENPYRTKREISQTTSAEARSGVPEFGSGVSAQRDPARRSHSLDEPLLTTVLTPESLKAFDEFMAKYPNKAAPPRKVHREWLTLNPSPALAERILRDLDARLERGFGSDRKALKYLPQAPTWLRDQHWTTPLPDVQGDQVKPETHEQIEGRQLTSECDTCGEMSVPGVIRNGEAVYGACRNCQPQEARAV